MRKFEEDIVARKGYNNINIDNYVWPGITIVMLIYR